MKQLLLKLKEYEYFLIPTGEKDIYIIKFDSEKERKHILKIIGKNVLNVEDYNNLHLETENTNLYITIKGEKLKQNGYIKHN